MAIATADVGCLWCDWIEHMELDKGLDMVDKAGVGEKKCNSRPKTLNVTLVSADYSENARVCAK